MIISNYVRDGLIFMVHPVYPHICMMMRIRYVECKNKENKIFTFRYKCYTDIASRPFKTNRTKVHVSCVRVQTKSSVFSNCLNVENDNAGSKRTGYRLFQAGMNKSTRADGLDRRCWNEQVTRCSQSKMTTSRKLGDWYAEFGHVRRFDVVQMSDTSISCILDCAAKFESNSPQIRESVEFVAHCLRNSGPFSKT